MPQGFARDLNLAESDSFSKDATALDNLAGTGRSNDISLFVNNLRNISSLRPTQIELIPNTTIFKVKSRSQIAFSNRTVVTHDGTEYTVVNSNGIDRFELVDELGDPFTNVEFDLIRSDAVTKENIQNLNPKTLQTIDPFVREEIEQSQEEIDIPATTFRDTTITQFASRVQPGIDTFTFKSRQTILGGKPNIIDEKFQLDGTISIINTQGLPPSETSPGLFIISDKVVLDENDNPTYDEDGRLIYQKARAFSNNTDPWTTDELTRETITSSTQANVNNLIVTNPRLNTIQVQTLPSGLAEPYTDFTHKILVKTLVEDIDNPGLFVEGEEYNLLCYLENQ